MKHEDRIQNQINFLFGNEVGQQLWRELKPHLIEFTQRNPSLLSKEIPSSQPLTESDAVLITYGDQFNKSGQSPLQSLSEFLTSRIEDTIPVIHILPFFPYSSDDGFSIIDYRQVNRALGTWNDINNLKNNYKLMFDAVINHISVQSEWFQAFLLGKKPFDDYFITPPLDADLRKVVRPRSTPLTTPFQTFFDVKQVWTTFSDDQVDLNYQNPRVLVEIIDLLLFYIEHGANIIRLDAIAYLWKEIGTSCIHLPQTHSVVKLIRAILDLVAPQSILITETNVPHQENISYFGDQITQTVGNKVTTKGDEAQMVYQFTLAPLVLHSFQTGNARKLTQWAASLEAPFSNTTFFNFLASHDGIGVRPAEGILTDEEIQSLVDHTLKNDGEISCKTNPDGSESVYELNITWYDALNNPHDVNPTRDINRFIASQIIMLVLAGVPGIYVHSLFGSRNCRSCFNQTGRTRSINREKFDLDKLEKKLSDSDSIASQVFERYTHLLDIRRSHPSFHPNSLQRILTLDKSIFSLVRTAQDGSESIICLVNVTENKQTVQLNTEELQLPPFDSWHDLISSKNYVLRDNNITISLEGFQAVWITPHNELTIRT